MKRKIFVSIALILTLVISIYLFLQAEDIEITEDNDTVNTNEEETISVVEEVHFVAVTHFQDTYRDDLSYSKFSELPKHSIVGYEGYLEDENIQTFHDSKDNLYKFIQQCENCLGLLPVDELDLRFKQVTIDGYNIFDKDTETYNNPIFYTKTVQLPSDAVEDRYVDWNLALDRNGQTYALNINKDSFTRFFVSGEIITARGVDIKWLSLSNNNLEFLMDRVKGDIIQADLAVSMLEHSYLGNPTPCPLCTSFVGDEAVIDDLVDVGFDAFSLSGNHIGDGGFEAQSRTEDLLKENNLGYFGAGANLSEASKPFITEIKGVSYAFLGAEDIADFYWATDETRGSNRYSKSVNFGDGVIDVEKVKKDISAAKEQADKVVVYMSWGTEYTNFATEHQQELAHLLIDSGADLIVSSHAHWVQNIELYNGKLILYGLGNFIFDQTHADPTRESIYVNLNFLDDRLINIEIVPILTCGYHFGARNLANEVINGTLSYSDVDNRNEAQECVWLQPKPLTSDHPRYKVILDRIFEYTDI